MSEIPINLKQIRYFIHVAEFGSFTHAANFLDIAQPVLSRQIRSLEVDIGKSLFYRHGRGVLLTDSGEIFLRHCRGIMHQVECAYEEIKYGQLSGQIALGLPPTIGRILAVPIIKKFKEELPKANLVITEALTSILEKKIIHGELDMGLVHNPAHSGELEISLLAEENLYLITSRGYELPLDNKGISLKNTADLPLILPSHPNTYRVLIEMAMAKSFLKPNIILELNSISIILDLVIEKVGCAILSRQTLSLIPNLDKVQYHLIHSPNIISRFYLAYSNKRLITKTQQSTKEIIRKLCAEHLTDEYDQAKKSDGEF